MSVKIEDLKKSILNNMIKSVKSDNLEYFNRVISALTDEVIREKDFYRWGVEKRDFEDLSEEELKKINKSIIEKQFYDFKIGNFSNSKLLDTFIERPDLLWNLTRWKDTEEDIRIFFKSFGILDYANFIKQSPIEHKVNTEEIISYINNKKECNLDIELINTNYNLDDDNLTYKVYVFLLYADIMLSICSDVIVRTVYNIKINPILGSFIYDGVGARYKTEKLELG